MAPTKAPAESGAGPTSFRHGHLAEVMRHRKLTDRKLGEMTGLAHTSICRYRNGQRHPSLTAAVRMAQALELPIGDLIMQEEAA